MYFKTVLSFLSSLLPSLQYVLDDAEDAHEEARLARARAADDTDLLPGMDREV